MIIVDGNNLFPSQIEALLFEIEGVEPHFQIILKRVEGLDEIELKVEATGGVLEFDEVREVQKFQEKIHHHLITSLGLHAKITLVEPKGLGRSMGDKIPRVIDRREL
jgi:phenylacetate-CoA ligase